jgi:hypothetical protein
MGKSWDSYRLGEPHEPSRRRGLKTLAIVAALMGIMMLPATARGGHSHGRNGDPPGGNSGVVKVVTDVADRPVR